MADIATNLQKLVDDRDDICAALVAKGVTAASTHGFDDFATDIASIPTGASESDVQNLVVASKPYYESRATSTGTTTITSEIYAYNKSSYQYPLYMLKGLTFTINRKYSVSGTYSGTTTADCFVILKNDNITIATYDLGRFTQTKSGGSLNTTVTSTFDVSNFQEYFSSYPNGLLYIQNTIITAPSGHTFTSVVTLSSTTIST